jgi:hypothetical protein
MRTRLEYDIQTCTMHITRLPISKIVASSVSFDTVKEYAKGFVIACVAAYEHQYHRKVVSKEIDSPICRL